MQITLYHSDTCPQCKMFMMLLDKKNIEYSHVKNEDVLAHGIHHVPTLEVDGKQMVGKEALDWIKQQ